MGTKKIDKLVFDECPYKTWYAKITGSNMNFKILLTRSVTMKFTIDTAKEKEAVAKILKENMEQAAELLVPLDVDVHEGASWFEAK